MQIPLRLRRASQAGQTTRRSASAHRQQQMWNILRGRNARVGVTAEDLAMLASTDTIDVRRHHAGRYLELLREKGIAQRLPNGLYVVPPSRSKGKPLAPTIMEVTFLYDPNSGGIGHGPFVAEEGSL